VFLLISCLCCTPKKENVLVAAEDPGREDQIVRTDQSGGLAVAARRIAETLSDSQLAGQLIMGGIDAAGSLSTSEKKRLGDTKPGAIMLFRKNLPADRDAIRIMTGEINAVYLSDQTGNIKPFIAVDHEGGSVHRFQGNIERLPPPLSYYELAKTNGAGRTLLKIETDAERSAKEINELGINMNLAPLVEALNDKNQAFLQDRSYGWDIDWVSAAACAFIRGMSRGNIACVIKHFPGNSDVDPHQKIAVLSGTEADLERLSLPFYTVIAQTPPGGVMVSHIIAQAWDSEHNGSLSSIVIQEKLITNGQFQGIVLADDFRMGGTLGDVSIEKKSLAALNAGADMVMAWPADIYSIHKTLLAALQSGKLSRERLLDAATRIITQKLRYKVQEFSLLKDGSA
jgi:beta-N-acetylhexosaminidase